MDSKHGYLIDRVSWPAFGDVTGEGLELISERRRARSGHRHPRRRPDARAACRPGAGRAAPSRRWLAGWPRADYRVIVPPLIDRTVGARNGRAKLTNREFVYRSAFELGRHMIGYEVQKVLALVDFLERADTRSANTKIGVFGYGEGGAIALYAAALDPRIDAVCVSGYFDDRNDIWRQPIDRNVFGLLGAIRRRRGRQL